MQRNKLLIWLVIILATAICSVTLLLPSPATWPVNEAPFHQVLIGDIIMASTYLGGALLFLANLDVYTSRLRRAYILLTVGITMAGVGTLQTTLLTVFNAWSTPYALSGAAVVPFLLSGLIMYMGVRSFANLVNISHPLTRAIYVIPAAIGIAVLATLIPHGTYLAPDEITYDMLIGLGTWSGILILGSGALIIKVRQQAGKSYAAAMGWLAGALFFSGAVLIAQAVYEVMKPGYDPIFDTVGNVLIVASGLVWIRAGYAFSLTKYNIGDIPLWRFLFDASSMVSKQIVTAIDMVTSTAALVSNSRDIDPLLDKVRLITVKLKPGEKLSEKDQSEVVFVYLRLEDYLTLQEPVRRYSRKELRSRFDDQLIKLVTDEEVKRAAW